jgi:hypothetical protein
MVEPAAGLRGFFDEAAREHAAAVAAAGGVQRELRFADRRLRMRFDGSALADGLLAALSSRLTALLGAEALDVTVPGATIALWEERHVPGGATPVPWSDADLGARGLVRGSDGVVAVHEAGSRAVTLVDPASAMLLYRVPSSVGLPWWERAAPLRPALFWALSGPGRHLVHAGVVGDEQRGGVLLAGAGGSGKTTVALAALAAGMRYISDDYILLHADPAPIAWNLFGTAKLDAGHLARFPTLASAARLSADPVEDEKAVLDVARLLPDALVPSLPIKAVLVPRIRGGRAALRTASAGEALLALAPSTTLQMPYDNGAVVHSLAALTRRVPAFALDVGDRVEELADAIDRVLDEVADPYVGELREPAMRDSA